MDLALAVGIILVVPILGNAGVSFSFVQNILIRLLLVIAIIIAIHRGPLTGIFTLLAVFTIILERNHQLLINLPGLKSTHVPSQGAGVPIKATPLTPHITYEVPHIDDHGISVSEKDGDALYESADGIKDNNPNLDEVPPNDEAPQFYESRGLA